MTTPAWIPTDAIPGVTVLPHWQAKYYTPNAIIAVDAVVWHFAEGGGTDSWLTHPTNDNSCHIVLKDTGAIRQIVSFRDASHSLHIDRRDGPPGVGDYGIFSLDAVQRVLGTGWTDPNTQIITIEIEGFAYAGPNAAQRPTILHLAKYLESLFPHARHLGHRDFQDYKPCPGGHLFVPTLLPHEGRVTPADITGDTDVAYDIDVQSTDPVLVDLPAGTLILNLDGTRRTELAAARTDVLSPFSSTTPGGTRMRAIVYTGSVSGDDLLLGVYTTSAQNIRPLPDEDAATIAALQAQVDALNENLAGVTTQRNSLATALTAQKAENKEVAASLTAAATKLTT